MQKQACSITDAMNRVRMAFELAGFNKTDMTAKYAEIWEVEGAVDVSIGAKRVVHEIGRMSLANTGTFVNCEDGMLIPW